MNATVPCVAILWRVQAPAPVTEARVTALMPVKKFVPGFLEAALQSLLAQTCPRWELLLVVEPPDVSRFGKILVSHLEDPRIHLVPNEGRRLAGALNTGMKRAVSEFVAILFADDLWSMDAVEVLDGQIQQDPSADFFHTSRRIIDEWGNPVSSVHPSADGVTLGDFVVESPVKHLLCWRRVKGLEVGGLDESLDSVGPDDFDFPWTMAEQGALFHTIPECLYIYRDHRLCERLSTDLPRSVHLQAIARILKKHGVPDARIKARIGEARRSHLRACLYRNNLDRRLLGKFGIRPNAWRETYD